MEASETILMRDRILQTATQLFVQRGYDGISMREISEACGISKAGLYYHFKDKEDLFLAILNSSLNDMEVIFDGLKGKGYHTREKIAVFVRDVFQRLPAARRDMIRLANQEMGKISPKKRDAFARQYHQAFIGPLTTILEEGVQCGELKPQDSSKLVWALLGLMYPFFSSLFTASTVETERVVQLILMVFFEGVAADGSA